MVATIQHYYGNGILKTFYHCKKKLGEKPCNTVIGNLDKLIHPLLYEKRGTRWKHSS